MELKSIRCVSIDIGIKNLAFYTEDFTFESIERLKEEFKGIKRKRGKEITPEYYDFLNKVYLCGERVEKGMGVFDIRDGESEDLNIQVRRNLLYVLNEYRWLWSTSVVVVIEEQFIALRKFNNAKSTAINIKAIKVAECILFWLMSNYPSLEVVMFPSRFKTLYLGAPTHRLKLKRGQKEPELVKMTKPDRKKWSAEKGEEILVMRGDEGGTELLECARAVKQKLDDACDCITQCQAFKIKRLIME